MFLLSFSTFTLIFDWYLKIVVKRKKTVHFKIKFTKGIYEFNII